MINILKKIKKDKTLCEIYSANGNADTFTVGYVYDCDDDYYILECVSPDGRWDGFQCRLTEDISMIRQETPCIDALKKLMPFYNFYHKDMDCDGKNVLETVLQYIIKNKKICRIETYQDSGMSGTITDASGSVVTVALVNGGGKGVGTGYVLKDDIDFISVEAESEIRLEILSK